MKLCLAYAIVILFGIFEVGGLIIGISIGAIPLIKLIGFVVVGIVLWALWEVINNIEEK